MPVELYYDEYLELSNILYLYNDKSHTSIINMITDIQTIVEEIHDYCIMNVYEETDLDTFLPTLRFCEKDIQFIQEKMTHIDYILYSTLTIICKEFSKNYHIIRLINAIKEKVAIIYFRYYTSVYTKNGIIETTIFICIIHCISKGKKGTGVEQIWF